MSTPPTSDDWASAFLATAETQGAGNRARATVLRRFCDELATLLGRSGAEAMFSRAVYLARQRRPVVAPLIPNVPSSSEEIADVIERLAATESVDASAAVAGELLLLVAGFIGVELTQRVLARIRPPATSRPRGDSQEVKK